MSLVMGDNEKSLEIVGYDDSEVRGLASHDMRPQRAGTTRVMGVSASAETCRGVSHPPR